MNMCVDRKCQLWEPQRAAAVTCPRESPRRTKAPDAKKRRSSENVRRNERASPAKILAAMRDTILPPSKPYQECPPWSNFAPCTTKDWKFSLWLIANFSASLAKRGEGRIHSLSTCGRSLFGRNNRTDADGFISDQMRMTSVCLALQNSSPS